MQPIEHYTTERWDATLYQSGRLGTVYVIELRHPDTGELFSRRTFKGKTAYDRAQREMQKDRATAEAFQTSTCQETDAFGGPCRKPAGHPGPHDDGCRCEIVLTRPILRQDCPRHGHFSPGGLHGTLRCRMCGFVVHPQDFTRINAHQHPQERPLWPHAPTA